ncbi:DUF6308 family protein [Cellulomonas xiejunii]|uniref:DUF6308 family protein n=1 Tax=Cellulomonas xiejunii TaxID=2968083 RepID=A0ABY5KNZ2_9CELL|nr:DUF6308 family protein [Cellulomonas xiejunii]MCC2319534.1 DUF6308 family protein [Cellulomonas xiejunii]UUI71520.1 DUF6308 family protein [Cellulomonas xiejunii]
MQISERLEALLVPAGEHMAVAALQRYFAPLPAGGFTGAYFERLGGGGDRPDVADTFTSDDIVAVSMLSVTVPASAVLQLLEARGPELGGLLAKIPTDVALAEITADEVGGAWPVRDVYRELLAIPGIGETTATKLLARKRPHLVPILDAVVTAELSVVKGRYWVPLHAWLTADECAGHRRLEELRSAAGLGSEVSVLRVFDVLAWMVGSGYVPEN